jgi:hypothetical protein
VLGWKGNLDRLGVMQAQYWNVIRREERWKLLPAVTDRF